MRFSRQSLRDTQIWMVGAITGAPSDAEARDVERRLTAGPRMTAAERLEIHRSGYLARLVECLADDFPVLAVMLGDRFEALCHAYVARYPSSSPNLNGFGRHMASFCKEADIPDFDGVRAFASELAALEWALVEVLHAEAPPPFELAELQAIPVLEWENVRFVTSDAVRLFRFAYPVNAFFQAYQDSGEAPALPAASPTAVAVYRKDTLLWRMDLTPAMTSLLGPLLEGQTIGAALAAIEADEQNPQLLAETGANLMVWFREWVAAGLFAGVTRAPE